ncbi:Serine/threonine-protein phosphatase 6 regulatory ankyrin repeat subunit A-like isoform X2 [Oopsacas minuta]|uniref:Serine/threonine-protein phosphatase 6 regulatory ankyrin repeat subunit A-like isoform X2 n=1 Tax=Oopsacas minuta TaxID=111878 RepID=A0AAV7JEY6_9METZ|nr:Serine/threonine-protein phosphatase 6 regulatory ankyrin repeat subunit A-like isoform X2 [Oopsacas minuta]
MDDPKEKPQESVQKSGSGMDLVELIKSNISEIRTLMKNPELAKESGTKYYDLLYLAARYGSKELMKIIITEDFNEIEDGIFSQDECSILQLAVEENNENTFNVILNWIMDSKQERGHLLEGEYGDDCNTPLIQAYNNKNYNIIFELVRAGADPSITNNFVFNTLHYAALDDNIEAIQAIVDGAREGGEEAENKLQQARETTQKNSSGFTPLCIVAHRGYHQIGTALLEAKADPNLLLTESRLCPLNYAAQHGRIGLVRELVKYGASTDRTDTSKSILYSAVFGGNYDVTKFLLDECGCNANIYDWKGDTKKKPLCIAIEGGHISIIKLLLQHGVSAVESVYSHDHQRPIHVAILSKQRQALQILLENGANPDDKTAAGATPAQLAVANDASTLLPLLLSYGISFTKRDVYGNTLLHAIASEGAVRCAEFLLQYLADNYMDQIPKLLLEEKDARGRTPVDRAVDEANEAVLIEFFKHIQYDYFIQHPIIYHQLIEKNLFDALTALMDDSVSEKYLDVTLTPKFLDSVSSLEHSYPDDPLYDRFEPSFLHKLLDCPDPLVKYHPLVSIVVREKLRFYRWWYVLTFILYCFFLINLFYALTQASYLCDDMLWSYSDNLSKGRAFCEVCVILSVIIFTIDQILSFLSYWYRIHRKLLIIDGNNDKPDKINSFIYLSYIPILYWKLNRVFYHFFTAVFTWSQKNFVFLISLLSMFILIILRVVQSPFQWTFASITIILFAFSFIQNFRISSTFAPYTNCFLEILYCEIPKFSIVIFIFVLSSSFSGNIFLGRIHKSHSEITGETCNDRIGYEDISMKLAFVYLILGFLFILQMLNLLMAQAIIAYKSLIRKNKFDFDTQLVVEFELESNVAVLLGRKLRNWNPINELTISHDIWNVFRRTKLDQAQESDFISKRNTKLLERNYTQLKLDYEIIRDDMAEMKLTQEKTLAINVALEAKLDQLLKPSL